MGAILFPWLHYLGIIVASGGIVAELYLLKLEPRPDVVKLLPRVDLFYFIGVLVILVSGIGRMFTSGKGAAYYMHVPVFHGVLGLTLVAAVLSLPPTFRYRRWAKALSASGALPDAAEWKAPRKIIHLQTAALAVIALLMVLTARGTVTTVAGAAYEGAASSGMAQLWGGLCPQTEWNRVRGAEDPSRCLS